MKITTLVCLVCVAVCGCSGPMSGEITIPQSAVQTGLDAWLPVVLTEYVDEELPAEITLERASALMSDGTDRIGVEMQLTVVLKAIEGEQVLEKVAERVGDGPLPPPPFGSPPTPLASESQPADSDKSAPVKTLSGTVLLRTGVRYDSSSLSFYCQDVAAESIVFEELPGDIAPLIQTLCEKGLDKYFSENSVYTLASADAGMDFAAARLKNVTTREGKLVVELGL
ncbi:MAG: hypothetical protein AAFX06_26370 [Planctomycetota bacterium]